MIKGIDIRSKVGGQRSVIAAFQAAFNGNDGALPSSFSINELNALHTMCLFNLNWFRRLASVLICFTICQGQVEVDPAGSRSEQLRATFEDATDPTVLVVTHRANFGGAPENSREAVIKAIEGGVDMIEIDIRRSKDGHFVVMHDATVDRTTNGTGPVGKLSLEELEVLQLRYPDGSLSSQTVPSLESVLLLAKDKVLVNLDKAEPYFEELIPILEATGTTRQVLLKGPQSKDEFDRLIGGQNEVLYMRKVSFKKSKKAAALNTWPAFQPELSMVEVKFGSLEDALVSKSVFENLKAQNVRAWVNTLKVSSSAGLTDKRALKDPDQVWGVMIDQGFSIIQTAAPEALLDDLQARGRR